MSFPRFLPSLLLSPALVSGLLAQVTQFGDGCPSSNGLTPTISVPGAPFAGAPLQLDLTGPPGKLAFVMIAFQNQTFGGAPLPLNLAFLGSPLCTLLVPPDFAVIVPFDAQGNATLNVVPAYPANTRIYAQSAVLFGPGNTLLDGLSDGLQIDAMTPTTSPVIASLSQLSGRAGELITVRGANFGNGPPTDVCMAVADANGDVQAFMKVQSRNDTEMTAEVKLVRPNATIGSIGFIRGSGQTAALLPAPGTTATQPAWNWRQAAVSPANMAMSPQMFTPIESDDDGASFCVPCVDGYVWFEQIGNQFVATLPDLCDGVHIGAFFSEFWWTDNAGVEHRLECQVEDVMICGLTPAARANYLALVLSFNLGGDGLGAFAPNANTMTLSLTNGGTWGGGVIALAWMYDPAYRATVVDGVCDNFEAPTEPTSLSSALATWQNTNAPTVTLAPFDEPLSNRHFMHTVPIPAGSGTSIVGLSLNLHLEALSSLATNDSIYLVVNGGQFVWGLPIQSLPGAPTTWTTGATLDVCLDLAHLPASNSLVTSVLAEAIAAGQVDIYIQDDTSVDCVSLTVQRCP